MEWMFMPLKRYADFSGRSRRKEYWSWVLFQFLLGLAYWVLIFGSASAAVATGDLTAMFAAGGAVLIISAVYGLLALIFFIPGLAVSVRRLHDTNRSGWWILAPLTPYVLIIFLAVGAVATAGPKPDQTTLASLGLGNMGLVLIMVVMALLLFVFMLHEGTPGPNRYGPNPKATDAAGVFS